MPENSNSTNSDIRNALRPAPDSLIVDLANYICEESIDNEQALDTARYCLLDSLGCALLALEYPACSKLLGPVVKGATMPQGARVPGTSFRLDPVQAAFNIGTMIRWLDYNDTWLAAEWGHPSDNLGGILAAADYLSVSGQKTLTMKDILEFMIKAYEIQGVLALNNSFNRVGLDHVILVRIATTGVVTALLGGNRQQVINALTNAWIDGGALRTYRHAPNTGSRKSWAAGDATSRGVWHALTALKGEMGYPSALSAKQWGFQDVVYDGQPITLQRDLSSYVMENILFKVSFPAEFHAQTAVEAALSLHPEIGDRLDKINEIIIETQESGVRIIDKTGPLANPADRDHCLQYMVAIPLIFGRLNADDYEDKVAQDPRIDNLRNKMKVLENREFTRAYLDPAQRAIPNAITVKFSDGKQLGRIQVDFPIGHRRRREEAIPLIIEKFIRNSSKLETSRQQAILALLENREKLMQTPLDKFMELLSPSTI